MSLAIGIPAALVLGYVLGSVSPAYALGRVLKGIDIRTVNFRNAGVRNVKATLGTWPAVATAIIDVTKGIWAVLLSQSLFALPAALIALPIAGAVAGHIFPFYLGFRGGKGTATAIGAYIYFIGLQIFAGAFPLTTFCALLVVALVMYVASRNGDVAGMVTFFFMLAVTPLELGWSGVSILCAALSLFILVSITRTAVQRGTFRLQGNDEVKAWRLIGRPFALLFIPIDQLCGRRVLLFLLGALCLVFVALDLARMLGRARNTPLFKASEKKQLSSITWFLVSTLLTFLIFPGIIPHLALAFTSVGDLFGKLVGLRFGVTVLRAGRTLQGSLAFFGGSLMASYILSRALPVPLLLVVAGSLFAAVVELFSSRVDDNLTVSLLSGGMLFTLRHFIPV